MENELMPVPAKKFLHEAGKNLEAWKILIGVDIQHSVYGEGRVIDIKGTNNTISIFVQFPNKTRRFDPTLMKMVEDFFLPKSKMIKLYDLTHPQTFPDKQVKEAINKDIKPIVEIVLPERRPVQLFATGDEVTLINHPQRRGMIQSDPFWGQEEWQYTVFFSATEKKTFRQSDLQSCEDMDVVWGDLDGFLRSLALAKLNQPLSDNLYALYGSRTKFEVYQFKPALKFLANPDQRLLIADEVGLGKTIEAGIIFLELQARLDLRRVLVVCPSALRYKWQDEMRLRFDEEFVILDMDGVRRFFHQYDQLGDGTRLRGIVSLELLRRPELADVIDEKHINIDLVIIDEAHHCRNTSTQSNKVANILADNADAMLLLTATPLQIGNEDLFNLLKILSPGEFDDMSVFEDRLIPNQHINRAVSILGTGDHHAALNELRMVEKTNQKDKFLRNPFYKDLLQLLNEPKLTRDQLVRAQRRLIEFNTLAFIFTRTRKREIADKVPTRAAFTLKVPFTSDEKIFYEQMIQNVRWEFQLTHGSNYGSSWVSIMRERQAASCITAARKRFGAILNNNAQPTAEEEAFMDPSVVGEYNSSQITHENLWQNPEDAFDSGSNQTQTHDSKFDIFHKTLEGVLGEDASSKILVFSFFRDTVEYLYDCLAKRGVGVIKIHGGFNVRDRQKIIERFRTDPKIRVMISSDVGAEGLDFQFCNTIFNYDLPWNPMKVEQRIGRIDRFGQESSRIRIYSLVIDDSIKSRILMRLYNRIGLFEKAIGDIEAILGEEIRELSRKVYSTDLTPEEESRLTDLTVSSILRRQQELEDFEQKKLQFMGQEAIFSNLVNQAIDSGAYVSETEIRSTVETFIKEAFPLSHIESNDDDTYYLDINDDLSQYLRGFVYNKRKMDKTAEEFLKIVIPGKEIPLTFSSSLAYERKILEFVMLNHPLTRAAIDYWKNKVQGSALRFLLGFHSGEFTTGAYLFFIFTLEAHGAEETRRLVPVVIDTRNGDINLELSEQFLRLVQTSAEKPHAMAPVLDQSTYEMQKESAQQYMALRRDNFEKEILQVNDAMINARLTALEQSYLAKHKRVETAFRGATDQRIRRMRDGQLRNMKAKYSGKQKEIDAQRKISVSFSLDLEGCVIVNQSL